MFRVPVQNPDGSPAMPTKASRARRWVQEGKATAHWNDAGVYYVRLISEPSSRKTQKIVIGCDPGKSYTGIAVQSAKFTLYTAHLVLPFQRVKERMGAAVIKNGKMINSPRNRALQRLARRGRKINRKIPFAQRAHRQKRFDNRRKEGKLAPSIRASRQMERRVITELSKIFPIHSIVYELIRADVDLTSKRKSARSGKGFSPVMVGQYWCVEQLKSIAPVKTRHGWQKNGNGTSQVRKYLGLEKVKDKKAQVPEAHAVDGIALAASEFIRFGIIPGFTQDVHTWIGSVEITSSVFRIITRPAYFRRALHFDNREKGGVRKRKGGTLTPFGIRYGDKVVAEKAGKTYSGWVGGFTDAKSKNISIYDHNWKRIGQFSPKKVKRVRRSNKLCVA
ncbi:RRXRR domain-containing protein [Roseofilum sp. Guam]|uniref:RRXRR domain-containing protein n=1 Tax=Roseofilum sp. Guam TaxID=2821502 RepID=UPI001B1F0D8E|nr:RRXRR domain-containing protein [Roseofilum sp. Guam]MBP0027084.1 RRXRR domain-containing protein [Roseofilum sp. Guam]